MSKDKSMIRFTKFRQFLKYSHRHFQGHPLWSNNLLSPYLRFAKLQILFVLGKRRVMLPWIDGLILPVEKGDSGLSGNYYLGLMEFKDMAFALHLLRPADLFVDIGANVGSYTLLAAGSANARCLTFEPVPQTFERLVDSIVLNKLTDLVWSRNVALSSPEKAATGSPLPFSADRDCTNSFVEEGYEGQVTYVNVETLDSECANLAPVLIKIDVEGFERDVLLGSQATLRKESMLALITEGQTHEVNSLLRGAGYLDISYVPMFRKILPVNGYTLNRIWVKTDKIEYVERRLRESRNYMVYGRSF